MNAQGRGKVFPLYRKDPVKTHEVSIGQNNWTLLPIKWPQSQQYHPIFHLAIKDVAIRLSTHALLHEFQALHGPYRNQIASRNVDKKCTLDGLD